jgi:hypothetical protein
MEGHDVRHAMAIISNDVMQQALKVKYTIIFITIWTFHKQMGGGKE